MFLSPLLPFLAAAAAAAAVTPSAAIQPHRPLQPLQPHVADDFTAAEPGLEADFASTNRTKVAKNMLYMNPA